MSLSPGLPLKLHNKFFALERKVRKLRAIQGAMRFVLLLICTAFLLIAADSYFTLPSGVRCVGFGLWLILGLWAFRRWVARPFVEPIDAASLAAAIEEQYPRLDERLTTAVELSQHPEAANGSPEFADQIVREATTRAKKLDFDVSLPTREVFWFSVLSLVAIIVILTPLFVVAEPGQKLSRFFAPWYTPKAEINFKITVSSGDPGVKRGEAVTLTGFVEPTKAGAVLPKGAKLVIKQGEGEPLKSPMLSEQENVYFLRKGNIQNDLEYAIEVGSLTSEWHRVRAVDPVNLVSANVTIQPPTYISKERETVEGLAALQPWQYSKIEFALQLDRTPELAYLEWTPERKEAAPEAGKVGSASIQKFNLEVDSTHLARHSFTAKENGSLRLVLESQQKVRNEFPPQIIQVRIDKAPKFEKVTGISEGVRQLNLVEKLNISAQVSDDVAVGAVELEYRVNGAEAKTLPLKIENPGMPLVLATTPLEFLKTLKENDRVEYRLIASDTRQIPDEKLGPQRVYFPSGMESWAVLEMRKDAPSLRQQDILAQQKETNDRLQRLIKEFTAEKQESGQLKKESRQLPGLNDRQVNRLGTLRDEVHESTSRMDLLGRDLGVTPDLQGLGNDLKALAEREARDAEAALQQSQFEQASEQRTRQFELAETNLNKIVEKLEELRQRNNQLAQQRLDQFQIDHLRDQQERLAEKTKTAEPKETQELLKQQKEIEDRLDKLLEEQDRLRKAFDLANGQEAEKIAGELKQLAQKQRDLAQAMQQTQQGKLQKRLEELLKKQQELMERAERLQKKTEMASNLSVNPKLDSSPTRDAKSSLEKGDINEAIKTQALAAKNLEDHAERLERAAKKAEDPREAARQLARWQQLLRDRLEEAKNPTEEQRKAFADEQERLQKAIESLKTPNESKSNGLRNQASENAKLSAENLKQNQSEKAIGSMKETQTQLEALSEALPSVEKRLANSKPELQQLRKEQESLSRQVEQALKPFEKSDLTQETVQKEIASKLADLLKRQEALTERLQKLDLPTLENRRDRTLEAMNRAEDDLEKPRPQDSQASQGQTRRELERLEQALNGQKPADEKVEELLQRQKQIEAASKDPTKPKSQAKAQSELNRELQNLSLPEATTRQNDALDRGRKLESALENNAKPEELARTAKQATETLEKLAEQLSGRDRVEERAQELLREQKNLTDEFERLSKKPNPQQMQEAKRRSQQLSEELRQLPVEQLQREKQQAQQALNQANDNPNPAQQKEAEKQLQSLADRLQKEQANREPKPAKKEPTPGPQELPSREDAQEARKLAQDQKQLQKQLADVRDEMAREKEPTPTEGNPLGELAKLQAQIAKDAEKLAEQTTRTEGPLSEPTKQAEQASSSAKQATDRLQNGDSSGALQAGRGTSSSLEQLTQNAKHQEAAKQARDLAVRQSELNGRLEELAGKANPERVQQQARQQQLEQEAKQLTERLNQMNEQVKPDSKAKGPAQEAQQNLDTARKEMSKSREMNGKNQPDQANEARKRAAEQLEDAAQRTMETGNQLGTGGKPMPGQQELGQSLKDARDNMENARRQLNQNNRPGAQESMQKAEGSLSGASQQLAPSDPSSGKPGSNPSQSSTPGGNRGELNGVPDLRAFGPEAAEHQGKSWGELPGELKTKILQDLKTRYGEDYAKNIRLYFEALAERK
jgi:hypothetical protein